MFDKLPILEPADVIYTYKLNLCDLKIYLIWILFLLFAMSEEVDDGWHDKKDSWENEKRSLPSNIKS